MRTKGEIRAEYDLLLELDDLLLQALAKAEQLQIAIERKRIVVDISRLEELVDFECSIQEYAIALGHGEEA